MKKLSPAYLGTLILSTLILSACGANKNTSKEGKLFLGHIVNGQVVTKENKNTHSVVAIIIENDNESSICTGTIVSPGFILTAAHCVDENPTKLTIVFSPNAFDKTEKKEIRNGDKLVRHADWGKHLPSGEGDIALIHFKGTLPAGYSPVKLANPNLKFQMGQKVLMLGYGVTNGKTPTGSGILRQTDSVILGQYKPTEIVTDGRKSSICFGDSGGPAFVQVGKDFVQWGIASTVAYSERDQPCTQASIHTAVMKYGPWIKSWVDKMAR